MSAPQSTIHVQPDSPRAAGPQGPAINWGLPYQPVNREDKPPYLVDPHQYSPINYGFDTGKFNKTADNNYGPSNFNGRDRLNIQNYYDQLLPTSINLRNRGLSDMLARGNISMAGAYAGQGVDRAAQQRAGNIESALASAASRGMGQSGALQGILRQNELGYLSNVGQAESAGNDMEVKRQAGIANQILGTTQADIDFYKYLNAGRDVATGRAGGTNIASLAGITSGAAGLAAWLAGGNSGNPSTINYGNGINAADPYTGNMNSTYNTPQGTQEDIYGTTTASQTSGGGSGGNGWLSFLG